MHVNFIDCVAQFEMEEKFNAIGWSSGAHNDYSAGLIAGGMSDGSLMVWNVEKQLQNDRSNTNHENAQILNTELYSEPNSFYCQEFNKFQPNLQATGGDQCYILDLSKF